MNKFQQPAIVTARLRAQAELISAARRARGYTQTELARRAGTSRPTIHRLESGDASVAWGTVMTVCWLLDVPTDPELMDPAHKAALLAGSADVQRVRRKELNDDF